MRKKKPRVSRSGEQQLPPEPKAVFAPTRPEDVRGSLRYEGPPKTIEEMDAGIVAEVKRRHARGRY
jgi:hypothetical protein